MFNTPFEMTPYQLNDNGRYSYPGSGITYTDHATPLAQANGGNWNQANVQGALTRDVLGFQNGQVMYGMNEGFNGLGTQMSGGFNDLADKLDYGGVYGNSQNRTYSPQSRNGYGTGWGGSNPFMIGSF